MILTGQQQVLRNLMSITVGLQMLVSVLTMRNIVDSYW